VVLLNKIIDIYNTSNNYVQIDIGPFTKFFPISPQNCDNFDLGKLIHPYDKNMDILNVKPYICDYPVTVL
jgi:hypothetical protein